MLRRFCLVLLAAALLLPLAARAQWTRVDALPADEVGALLVRGDRVVAGAHDAVYVSRDAGGTWTRSAPLPDDVDGVWALAEHDGRLFAGTYGGVLESLDDGATWRRRDDGLDGLGARTLMSLDVRDGHLYAGTGGAGVFRLDLGDAAARWQRFGAGLPGNIEAVRWIGDLLVVGGSANGYVSLYDASSATWTERSFVAFDPNGPQMYDVLGVSGVLVGGSSHGFFRSTDRGQTWARFAPGVGLFSEVSLTTRGARVIAVASRTSGGTYVYASDDAGLSWQLLEHVRGTFAYSAAAVGDRLFTGRFDGLWVRSLTPTSATPPGAPEPTATLTAAPNPFAATTRLAYTLAAPSDVDLALYDLLGRRVATLARGPHPPGAHTAAWPAEALAPGTYVVRLIAGAVRATRVVHRIE